MIADYNPETDGGDIEPFIIGERIVGVLPGTRGGRVLVFESGQCVEVVNGHVYLLDQRSVKQVITNALQQQRVKEAHIREKLEELERARAKFEKCLGPETNPLRALMALEESANK